MTTFNARKWVILGGKKEEEKWLRPLPGLFQRRRFTPLVAEALADRLATRDYERDNRRMCVECASLQANRRCFVSANQQMPHTDPRFEPVRTILQRCDHFTFQKP